MDYFKTLIDWIKENKPSKQQLAKQKVRLCREYKKKEIPTDIEVYLNASSDDAKEIREYIETKPTRTGSGVAVIAVMMKPFDCPHGKCIMCPGGIKSVFGTVPQSYTGKEPSTMRGIRNEYDPYRIIFNRLEQYIVLGQNPNKVEQIFMGGTFCALPLKKQKEYAYYSYKAYNDFSKLFFNKGMFNINKFKTFFELPGKVDDKLRAEKIKNKIIKLRNKTKSTLEKQQKKNEKASIRCIGLTVETRPDYGFKKQGLHLLKLGVTRVELGIQTTYDDVLKKINRGHSINDSIKSIAELRDLGFKLNFHMMPGLPGSNYDKDLLMLKNIFEKEEYMPDMLKIYPCMVMPGTKLENIYKKGKYKPLNMEQAAEMIAEAFRNIPEWCRVMRIQRDIPTNATSAGVNKTNLRQYVDKICENKEIKIRDIRAREIRKDNITEKPKIIVREYKASNGKEFFISMEANDKILGFTRLRFIERSLHPLLTLKTGIIRELHVYGTAVNISGKGKVQHTGIGKRLLEKAETISKINGKNKIVIISGIGVREYYKKLGYTKKEPYMIKKLK
jgi:elongator complex protein 3